MVCKRVCQVQVHVGLAGSTSVAKVLKASSADLIKGEGDLAFLLGVKSPESCGCALEK